MIDPAFLENAHFVEIISNDAPVLDEWARYRFFVTDSQYEVLKNIIDVTNNHRQQCVDSTSRACFGTENSFTAELDMVYFVEESFSFKAVHEGSRANGKKQGLLRLTDKDLVMLAYYNKDWEGGKNIYKYKK